MTGRGLLEHLLLHGAVVREHVEGQGLLAAVDERDQGGKVLVLDDRRVASSGVNAGKPQPLCS